MQALSIDYYVKKNGFTLDSNTQEQNKQIEPYSKVTKAERLALSTALKQASINVTSSHHHVYQYLMENITLPSFYKSAETVAEEIGCICVRTIKKIKKEFEAIGILTKINSKEYHIHRIHKTAEKESIEQSGKKDQEPQIKNQWTASPNHVIRQTFFKHQTKKIQNENDRVGESANISGDPCKKYPAKVQKMHTKIYYKNYKFNEEVLINNNKQNLNLELYATFKKHGLSTSQISYFSHNFSQDYLQNKVNQLEFMLVKYPKKVQGEARYLYQSIQDDWICEEYYKYLDKKKREDKIYQENQAIIKRHIETKQDNSPEQTDVNYKNLPDCVQKLCSFWNLDYKIS